MRAARWRGSPADAHKGQYGHLLVVAGSRGKTGAAALAARRGPPERGRTGDRGHARLPAAHHRDARRGAHDSSASGDRGRGGGEGRARAHPRARDLHGRSRAGTGLSLHPEAQALARALVADLPRPMVVDADALSALAGHLDILAGAPGPRVLTPHPGEMARMLGMTVTEIQADRLERHESLRDQAPGLAGRSRARAAWWRLRTGGCGSTRPAIPAWPRGLGRCPHRDGGRFLARRPHAGRGASGCRLLPRARQGISGGPSAGKRGCSRAISWRPSPRAVAGLRDDPPGLRHAKPRGDAGAGRAARRRAAPGAVVACIGELGAGKTCFLQGLARGLRVTSAVTSPTFVLVNHYRGRLPVYPSRCLSHGGAHGGAGARSRGDDARRRGHGHRVGRQDPAPLAGRRRSRSGSEGWATSPAASKWRSPERRCDPGWSAGIDQPGGPKRPRATPPERGGPAPAPGFCRVRRLRVLLSVLRSAIDAAEVQRDLARFWTTLVLFDAHGRRLFSTMDLGKQSTARRCRWATCSCAAVSWVRAWPCDWPPCWPSSWPSPGRWRSARSWPRRAPPPRST